MQISDFSPFIQGYMIFVVTVFGLIVGSFLNVVALRLLSGESIVFPNSKCTKCSTAIKWYDNIPVFSYILLGGKCRNCKEKISIQYPVTEAVTAMIFLGVFLKSGIDIKTVFLWILSSALIVMTITDIKEKLIFDIISIPIIPLGLLYNFINTDSNPVPLEFFGITFSLNEIFISAFFGCILGAVVFEVFSGIGTLLVGQRAFGEGDTIIAAALGAWFGWQSLIVIVVLSFLFQLIFGIPVIVYGMFKQKDHKSLGYMGILIFSIAIPYLGKILNLTQNMAGALTVSFLSFLIAGIGAAGLLKDLKKRQNFTFLPFGPALVFGGFVIVFWGEKVVNYCTGLF